LTIFFLFLLATTFGCVSTLFWVPEDDMGRGYFQMNALIVLGLLALAVAVLVLHPFRPFGDRADAGAIAVGVSFVGAFLYYMAIWRENWRRARLAAGLTLAASGGALLLVTPELSILAPALPYRLLLSGAAVLSSALLLGWSLITMLLGHWYLVSPRLTFRHLVIFCWVLMAVIGARLLTVGAGLTAAAVSDAGYWQLLTGFTGQGMFFWFRVLWGLAIPLTLGILSLHCARQRSNQSATGILYVVVVGSFIGELTAYYLMVTTGVPV
jgi:hypothetical protein